MRIFKENQGFNQWWLYVIVTITLAVWLLLLLDNVQNGESFKELSIHLLFGLLLILVTVGIFSLQLETRIDNKGVTARFGPFKFLIRQYQWKDIEKIWVRRYSPLAEYGGWGIRGLGTAKAYNVKGNNGIQIVTKDKKEFLIGTQKPEEAERIIRYYYDNLRD